MPRRFEGIFSPTQEQARRLSFLPPLVFRIPMGTFSEDEPTDLSTSAGGFVPSSLPIRSPAPQVRRDPAESPGFAEPQFFGRLFTGGEPRPSLAPTFGPQFDERVGPVNDPIGRFVKENLLTPGALSPLAPGSRLERQGEAFRELERGRNAEAISKQRQLSQARENIIGKITSTPQDLVKKAKSLGSLLVAKAQQELAETELGNLFGRGGGGGAGSAPGGGDERAERREQAERLPTQEGIFLARPGPSTIAAPTFAVESRYVPVNQIIPPFLEEAPGRVPLGPNAQAGPPARFSVPEIIESASQWRNANPRATLEQFLDENPAMASLHQLYPSEFNANAPLGKGEIEQSQVQTSENLALGDQDIRQMQAEPEIQGGITTQDRERALQAASPAQRARLAYAQETGLPTEPFTPSDQIQVGAEGDFIAAKIPPERLAARGQLEAQEPFDLDAETRAAVRETQDYKDAETGVAIVGPIDRARELAEGGFSDERGRRNAQESVIREVERQARLHGISPEDVERLYLDNKKGVTPEFVEARLSPSVMDNLLAGQERTERLQLSSDLRQQKKQERTAFLEQKQDKQTRADAIKREQFEKIAAASLLALPQTGRIERYVESPRVLSDGTVVVDFKKTTLTIPRDVRGKPEVINKSDNLFRIGERGQWIDSDSGASIEADDIESLKLELLKRLNENAILKNLPISKARTIIENDDNYEDVGGFFDDHFVLRPEKAKALVSALGFGVKQEAVDAQQSDDDDIENATSEGAESKIQAFYNSRRE